MQLIPKLSTALIFSFATRAFVILAGLLMTVVTTKFLSLDGRGTYVFAVTLAAFACQFGNLGLHGANTFFVSKNPELLTELMANSILISIFMGSIVSLLTIVLSLIFKSHLKEGMLIVYIVAISIPFSLLLILFQNLALGIHKIHVFNISEIILRYTSLLLAVFLLITGLVSGEAVFFVSIFSTALAIYFLYKNITLKWAEISWSSTLFYKCLNYGYRAFISSLFSFAVIRIGTLYIGYYKASSELAIYSIAFAIFDFIYTIPSVVASIYFPRVLAIKCNSHRVKYTLLTAILVGGAVLLIALTFIIFGNHIVRVLFSREYSSSIDIFLFLAPGLIAISINSILMNYFAAQNLPAIVIYSPAFSLLIQIVCIYFFEEKFGINGVAFAFSVSAFLMLFLSLTKIILDRNHEFI